MLDWWRWLFVTAGFRPAGAAPGWTDGLERATIASNLLIAAGYLTIAALMAALLWGPWQHPAWRRSRTLVLGFVALLATGAATHVVRALTFSWPFYHLQVVANGIAACISVSVAWFLVPLMLSQGWRLQAEDAREVAERLDTVVARLAAQEQRILEQSMVEDVRLKMIQQLMQEVTGGAERSEGV